MSNEVLENCANLLNDKSIINQFTTSNIAKLVNGIMKTNYNRVWIKHKSHDISHSRASIVALFIDLTELPPKMKVLTLYERT